MDIFALMARQRDIRHLLGLWNKNKAENTEMIDLVRSILGDADILAKAPAAGEAPALPSALRKYSTSWIQTSLNKLVDADLRVDGDLGGENSRTRRAVRKFQEQNVPKDVDPKKWVDGDPGVQTVALMEMRLRALEAETSDA
jgi:hypothetical protein